MSVTVALVCQGDQRRTIEQTLDLAWWLLGHLPAGELRRIDPDLIGRHRTPTGVIWSGRHR